MHLAEKIQVKPLPQFDVPQRLSGLVKLAYNFYWSWHPEVQALFARLDSKAWAQGLGPVRVLMNRRDYADVLADKSFMDAYDCAMKGFEAYMADEKSTWYATKGDPKGVLAKGPVAYFCAEFALHESFNIYSGGLGVLAGDHCKEASDMGLPFMGIGLFYRRGFFKQMVDGDGRQEHFFPTLDPEALPLRRVLDKGGKPAEVSVEFPGRTVYAEVWMAQVGRIPVLLLDTDTEKNAVSDRPITSQLYVSSRDMRLHQELILGVGGVRTLRALDIKPAAWHMNEGHSAFLLVERLREHVAAGLTFEKAQEEIRKCSVFTIHTPVPAGNERFWGESAAALLAPVLTGSKIDVEAVMALAKGVDKDPKWFDMTAMGLRLSNGRNGVSLLHGHTADDTWRKVTQKQIIGVTNGVHMPTWLGEEMKCCFAQAKGSFATETKLDIAPTGLGGRGRWEPIVSVDSKKVWDAHVAQKKALVQFASERMRLQRQRHGEGPGTLKSVSEALNPEAFIIGFARRFATYKRASLIFSDEKRLLKLLDNKSRPVQIVFAGKAHPADRPGQKLIAKVWEQTQSARFRGKVFFIEDYDLEVGRALVQGVDMWLNNPRRPLEASGTSGMKAAANGAPNMSILDGWWDEAWDHRAGMENGYAIGDRQMLPNEAIQDKNDASSLYHLLETKVLPAFFDRDSAGVPEAWVKVMKNSIASCVYDFSTLRMLEDYMAKMYLPAAE